MLTGLASGTKDEPQAIENGATATMPDDDDGDSWTQPQSQAKTVAEVQPLVTPVTEKTSLSGKAHLERPSLPEARQSHRDPPSEVLHCA